MLLLGLGLVACGDDTGTGETFDSVLSASASSTGDEDESAEGDSDSMSGDGDGDSMSGDGDGDSMSGDGDGEGTCGDGIVDEGEVCDDGVNDGSYGGCDPGCVSLGDYCGDELVNGPELCDDGNESINDGCLPNCRVPASCREILEYDFTAPDGVYVVAPRGPDFPFSTTCDMSTDGGGWTGIPLAELCSGNLDTELTAVQAAPTEGIDGSCRPFTRDGAAGHSYYFDVVFPPGFEAFFLRDMVIKANALGPDTSEVVPANFAQTSWNSASLSDLSASGDVSYGSGDADGPAVSFGATLPATLMCTSCETAFPAGETIYELGAVTTLFRMGWGEVGGQLEGWYPWWSGEVFLR